MFEGMYAAAAGMAASSSSSTRSAATSRTARPPATSRERVGFRDLLYNQVNQAGTATTVGAGAAAEGDRTRPGPGRRSRAPATHSTSRSKAAATSPSSGPTVSTALTRSGAFELDARGQLTTSEGDLLDPPITLPAGVSPADVTIAANGAVTTSTGRALGKITLVTVPSPDHLLAAGAGLFTTTAASGPAQAVNGGTIHQSALETSNVNVSTEMVQLLDTQRSYQLESTAIQTENQMMSIANQLVK